MSEQQPGGWPPFFPSDLEGTPQVPSMRGLVQWLIIVGVIVVAFVALSVARNIYTDLLWFDNVGYTSVFLTILTTKVSLFVIGALAFAVVFLVNVLVAQRFARTEESPIIPLEILHWIRRLVLLVIVIAAVVLSLIFGAVLSAEWELFLKIQNAVPFGQADPVFHKDVSFYAFTLPPLRFIQGWLIGSIVVSALGVLGLYLLDFSLRAASFRLSTPMKVHLSILGAILLLLLAWGYWFDIYGILFSTQGAVFGTTYAEVNARLLGLRVLIIVAVGAALALIVNLFLDRGTRIPIVAVTVWIGASLLLGVVFPGFIQRFQVLPNEFALEKPYIENNIRFTREAFGLNQIEEQTLPGDKVTSEDILGSPDTIRNVRLWDVKPLKDTLNQIQFLRLYYEFQDVDVDRYVVDKDYRQVMLGARELDIAKLDPQAQTWINQRIQYTHGYGVTMSPVTEFTTDGRPKFIVKDIPPAGSLPIKRSEIYFGEKTENWVIVNSNTAEFDYPTKEDVPVYTRYGGKGGVGIGSYIRRLAYAWRFGDINILISGELTPESRIVYYRNIQERVSQIAPFLKLDYDPYIVVGDERLWWIQDAYTVTDRYPYSEPLALGGINYIRNSVKIVVNAYDGFVTFYVADPNDAIIKTYEKIFPDLFQPMEKMPDYLKAHIRYPEDLFRIQSRVYLRYHMKDARVFYNKEDLWSVPNEIFYGAQQPLEPYYVIMRLPGEPKEEFVLIMPFTPSNKPNMVGWLAARSDVPNYGKLLTFLFPKDRQLDGPSQVEARINNDPDISREFTLWGQQGSKVIRGNLLVIPIGKSVLYVEPIYLQAENLAFPELKRVIVATSDKVVMRPTLEESLLAATGVASATVAPPQPPTGEKPPAGAPSVAAKELQAMADVVKNMQEQLNKLDEALKKLIEKATQ